MKKSELRQIIKEEISKTLGEAQYKIGDKVKVAKGVKMDSERIVVSKTGVDPKNTKYPTPGKTEGTVSTFDKLKGRVYVVFPSIGEDEYGFLPNEISLL